MKSPFGSSGELDSLDLRQMQNLTDSATRESERRIRQISNVLFYGNGQKRCDMCRLKEFLSVQLALHLYTVYLLVFQVGVCWAGESLTEGYGARSA